MKTLTLEHLAPYLPYGLKYLYKNEIKELVNIHYFYSHDEYGEMTGRAECTMVYDQEFGEIQCLIISIKPILRPLSDLTKEIEHNGEKFVPIDYLQEKGVYITPKGNKVYFDELAVKDYLKLLSWHFDIKGLIEQGLAIDINTLKK